MKPEDVNPDITVWWRGPRGEERTGIILNWADDKHTTGREAKVQVRSETGPLNWMGVPQAVVHDIPVKALRTRPKQPMPQKKVQDLRPMAQDIQEALNTILHRVRPTENVFVWSENGRLRVDLSPQVATGLLQALSLSFTEGHWRSEPPPES
jgi:hypothetical protein